jgi:hypothetical protein
MDESEITKRESGFVRGLAQRSEDTFGDWLTYSMTTREEHSEIGNSNHTDMMSTGE